MVLFGSAEFLDLVVGDAPFLGAIGRLLAECSRMQQWVLFIDVSARVLDALDIISVDDLTQKSTWDSHTHRSMSVVARGAPGG